MDIIPPQVLEYADQFTSPEEELLQQVAADTVANHSHAHMLSGHQQGKFLEMISTLLQPRRILEIGTFTGYSALYLAKGLQPDGVLHTIELRAEDAAVSQANFDRSNDREKIILHTGNALEIIPTLTETWDLVFIDADKVGYSDYYELVVPRVRQGGVILADNVLFHGQVLEQPITGKNAKAIQSFNERVQKDPRVENVLVTIRDGLLMIRKK
ncbi:O-methyltransferase [Paraflavitalea pollutisoli]|uniref:O-methyltransferase n=1 Tax=Paraflavitalea pollutisoli TaxID=3034143 RepID=UPI0023ED310B|nr:O-methyltransferase [Paraflavitalea sp. H1-2-19X]